MAPRSKQAGGGGFFGCCQPKRKGPAPSTDPSEIVVEPEAKEHVATLPGPIEFTTNFVQEVQPDKEEVSKISYRPRADTLYDTVNKLVVIVVGLPGYVKDEVDIEVEKGLLTVSGQCRKVTPAERIGDGLKIFNRELQFGHFTRCFQLPPNVLEDSVEANMRDGLIEIRFKCVNPGDKKKVPVT